MLCMCTPLIRVSIDPVCRSLLPSLLCCVGVLWCGVLGVGGCVGVVWCWCAVVCCVGCATAPRDLVLTRSWREYSDGRCVIRLDSTRHRDCPVRDGFVRWVILCPVLLCGASSLPTSLMLSLLC